MSGEENEDTQLPAGRSEFEAALSAFERGNYRLARELAKGATNSDDEAARLAAQDLLARLETPGLTKTILVVTGALLTIVTLFAYHH
jgi:hypothetical protein